MVTDDERREVARRLREYVDLPDDWWQETCAEFYVEKCVFGNVDRHSEAELFTRLADLIEPSCDREALLELADEMDDVAGCVRIKGSVAVGWVGQWSKSIREACGEVE